MKTFILIDDPRDWPKSLEQDELGWKVIDENVFERFKRFYNSLNDDEQGDIYYATAAVRGPDMNPGAFNVSNVKESTTKKIRSALFGGEFTTSYPNEAIYTAGDVESACGEHFLRHLIDAQNTARTCGIRLRLFKGD